MIFFRERVSSSPPPSSTHSGGDIKRVVGRGEERRPPYTHNRHNLISPGEGEGGTPKWCGRGKKLQVSFASKRMGGIGRVGGYMANIVKKYIGNFPMRRRRGNIKGFLLDLKEEDEGKGELLSLFSLPLILQKESYHPGRGGKTSLLHR